MVFSLQRRQVYLLRLMMAVWLLNLLAMPVLAHEVRPAIVDLELDDQGSYQATVILNIEALLTGMVDEGDEHQDTDEAENAGAYNAFRALEPVALEKKFRAFAPEFLERQVVEFNGVVQKSTLTAVAIPAVDDVRLARDSRLVLAGTIPAGSTELVWQWPKNYGSYVLRVGSIDDAEGYSAYVQGGGRSEVIPLLARVPQSGWAVFKNYVPIGFAHILPKGLDHILFVVGLFLLSASVSALLWQVTSFTLAHSVTLALGMLGWVQVSSAIVEPLIAASIIYVCLENLFSDKLSRWRPAVIFGFGLLHGLGFASVLTEVGLSGEHFVAGLIAFNVGVELGQLSVIALCFLAVGFWFRHKPWYRHFITIPASLIIAGIGTYWLLERTVLA